MVSFILAMAGLMATGIMAGPIGAGGEHTCVAHDLRGNETDVHKRQNMAQDDGKPIQLNVVFHLCCASEADCPKNDVAEKEVAIMNKYYSVAQINWNLKNVTRLNDTRCTQTNLDDQATMDEIKAKVRQGSTDTLNVVAFPTNNGTGTKGVAYIPPSENIAASVGPKDGAVVSMSTLPEQKENGPRQSGAEPDDITTTHEAAHFLQEQHIDQPKQPLPGKRSLWARFVGGDGGDGGKSNIMMSSHNPYAGLQYTFDQGQAQRMRGIALERKAESKNGAKEPKKPGDPLAGVDGASGSGNGAPGSGNGAPGSGNGAPGSGNQIPGKPPVIPPVDPGTRVPIKPEFGDTRNQIPGNPPVIPPGDSTPPVLITPGAGDSSNQDPENPAVIPPGDSTTPVLVIPGSERPPPELEQGSQGSQAGLSGFRGGLGGSREGFVAPQGEGSSLPDQGGFQGSSLGSGSGIGGAGGSSNFGSSGASITEAS